MNRPDSITKRIEGLDWDDLHRRLDRDGYAPTPQLLTRPECEQLVELYESARFRKQVDMGRYRYGEGEYKYFDDPLPEVVATIRNDLYRYLAPVANGWAVALRSDETYPEDLDGFLTRCHGQGQVKPTPLLLRYEQGGFNCLHQDVYGSVAFPLQVVVVLSRLGHEFTGGEFLLLEQRPRAQSRGEAIALDQGHALIFPNRVRPVAGVRGFHRVNVRHGVSTLRSGRRFSLGIIFHDAE